MGLSLTPLRVLEQEAIEYNVTALVPGLSFASALLWRWRLDVALLTVLGLVAMGRGRNLHDSIAILKIVSI